MSDTFTLGGNRISAAHPLPVSAVEAGGPTLSEKNATVSVGATSTALIGASPNAARWTTLVNNGSQTVYLGFGEDATTAKFPLVAGAIKETAFLGAINGIVASGTCSVAVLGVAR